MSSSLINVAVIGLGGMGMHHVKAVIENAHCRLKYVNDIDPARAQGLDALIQHQAQKCDFEGIMADADVHVVCVASYDDQHAAQISAAIKAGKHVYVEKPMCQNENELLSLWSSFKTSRVQLVSNLVLRTAPLYHHIRDLILSGALGQIYAFDGDYLYGRIQKITEGWRKETLNYSVMEGGGIHMIDLMMWLTGQKPLSVTTLANKIATSGTAFRYNDFQSSTFFFPSGMIGRVTANFGCVHKHQHVVRIFGTKGTFICDDQGARIYWSRDPEGNAEFLDKAPKPLQKAQLFHSLIESIQKGGGMELASREFDLMSVVLASDSAIGKYKEIEYLTC